MQRAKHASRELAKRSRNLATAALVAATATTFMTLTTAAQAEELTIKDAGRHPSYAFELEPELILVFNRSLNDGGPGAGVRGSIPFGTGFVTTINDTVGITFGFDKDPLAHGNAFYIPVALQWNFWFSPHWSAFGEPGVLLQLDGGLKAYLQVWAGGRYAFGDAVALTLRLSAGTNIQAFSIGPSFFF